MTNREQSEKLSEIADKIDHIAFTIVTYNEYPSTHDDLIEIIKELRSLSNEKYTPAGTSWDDLKNKRSIPSSKKFPF